MPVTVVSSPKEIFGETLVHCRRVCVTWRYRILHSRSRGHNVNLLCWGPRSPLLDEIARAGVTCGDSRSDGHAEQRFRTLFSSSAGSCIRSPSCRYLLAMPTEGSRKVAGQAHDHRFSSRSTSANVKRLRQSESIGILSSEDARFLADPPKAVGIAGWPQRNGLVVVPTSRPAPTTKGLAALRRSLRYLSIYLSIQPCSSHCTAYRTWPSVAVQGQR